MLKFAGWYFFFFLLFVLYAYSNAFAFTATVSKVVIGDKMLPEDYAKPEQCLAAMRAARRPRHTSPVCMFVIDKREII